VDTLFAKLRIPQPRHGIVFVEALLGLGGGFDIPLQHTQTKCFGNLLGEFGFPGAGLPFNEQRAFQGDRGIDSCGEVFAGDIGVGTGETV